MLYVFVLSSGLSAVVSLGTPHCRVADASNDFCSYVNHASSIEDETDFAGLPFGKITTNCRVLPIVCMGKGSLV